MRDLFARCRPYREVEDPDYVPSAPPTPTLAQSRRIWVAVRGHLLGDQPDPPVAERLRALLREVCCTHRERILTLYRYMGVLPPEHFVALAERCGWSPAWEQIGISAHLAILAIVLATMPETEEAE